MNVFKLRNDLISEYNIYISSFVYIYNQRIRNNVHPSIPHQYHDNTTNNGPILLLHESHFEKEKPEPKPTVKEPETEYKDAPPTPIDWDLYKCQGCGQILASFARYEHLREVHKGVDPGFERFKEG